MTWKGLKKTVPAVAPLAAFADTDIFAHAPRRLTASGVSDLLGKYICLADWKIASLLTGEYICSEIIEMEEKALKTVCSCVKGIASGEPEDCEKLMYALILPALPCRWWEIPDLLPVRNIIFPTSGRWKW